MPQPPQVIHLDEIEPVSGPGSLTWLPVRRTLGIEAFGTNAYIAADAGDDVVEPHTELEPDEDVTAGHQELYFVARGRATFTIDGEQHDAPAGTYVFIADPTAHRHAVANEAGTTVLSFGGPPTFVPSAWEWAFGAAALLHSDPERARSLLTEGLARHPGDPGLGYNLACLEALEGNADEALALLERAVADQPKLRRWAAEDDDLASLRDDPRFARLTAGS
jgi:mannose-6-phosphate isomerase-like protein (cupin superfamily)